MSSRGPIPLLIGAFGLALAMVVLIPAIAHACPACFAASGRGTLRAYYLSTVILSTMPLVMIGTVVAIALASKRAQSLHQRENRSNP